MKLPPKAYRFLLRSLQDMEPAFAREWAESYPIDADLPNEELALVRSVLSATAEIMWKRSQQTALADDDRADIANDLEFIIAVLRGMPEPERPLSAVA